MPIWTPPNIACWAHCLSLSQCVRAVMRLWDPENFAIKRKTPLLFSNEETSPLITCPPLQHFEDQAVRSPGFDTLHERGVQGKREERGKREGMRRGKETSKSVKNNQAATAVQRHFGTIQSTWCFKMRNSQYFIPNHPTVAFPLPPSGLMLSAYARVGAVLGDKALLERAVQAGNFLQEHLWDAQRQIILRSCYRGDEMEVHQM